MSASSRVRGARLNRRRFVTATGTAGAAAFIAACGGSDDNESSSSGAGQAQATTTSGTAAAGGQAAEKPTGTVTIIQGVEANSLDPAIFNATPESVILSHVMDTLLWRDAKTLKPVPWLAQEFKNVDPTTWEFKLRPNIKFHDGTPVNSEAVKFSLDRWGKEKVGSKVTRPRPRRTVSYDSVEVVDATTFRIKTSAPAPTLLDALTGADSSIISPAAYTDESDDNLAKVASNPVGSGPWKLVDWQKDQRMTLEVNPDWWGPTVAFEKIVFRPIGETSTRILALKNGEADVIVNVPPDNAPDIEKGSNTRLSKVDGLRKIFVGLRVDKHPALGDKRVRQAINHAMNWDAISRALLNGEGERMKTIMNPPHEPADAKAYTYDQNRAKQLLAEAGYANGFTIDMDAPTGRYIKDKELAQAIVQDLDKVGIKVNLNVLEWSVYAGQKLLTGGPGPAPMYFVGLGAPVTGQDEAFFFHDEYGLDFTDWPNSPEYTQAFNSLKVELDEKKFQGYLDQLNKIIWDEAPWLFIYNQVDFYGASKKIAWDARPDERIAMFEAKWA
ncbi:MAG: ABC transporter substrate-binding protein [Dehalococcoidia bacterium]